MSKQKKVPCGKVEMLVLEYLAENRSSLIQPMQLAIGKHYKVVYEAVTRLETNGLIEVGELKKSNDSYELSVKGIGFVWAYSDNFNVIKQSLKNYNDVIGSHNNQDYLTL